MLQVNDYVKLNTNNDKVYVGVIVNMNMFSADVSFAKPIDNELNIPITNLIKISEKQYYDYLGLECKTDNYTIDHVKDNSKSIEQQIDDIYYDGTIEVWSEYGYPEYKENNEKRFFELNFTDEMEKLRIELNEPHLTGKWQSALKEAYIDMALQTKDYDWLKELVDE